MAVIAIGLSVATAKGVLVCFTVTVALNAVIAWGEITEHSYNSHRIGYLSV